MYVLLVCSVDGGSSAQGREDGLLGLWEAGTCCSICWGLLGGWGGGIDDRDGRGRWRRKWGFFRFVSSAKELGVFFRGDTEKEAPKRVLLY